MTSRPDADQTMARLVGRERADVLNSGVVKDSESQSKSTLAERKSAARSRRPPSAPRTSGPQAQSKQKLGISEIPTSDERAGRGAGREACQAGKAEGGTPPRLKARLKQAAAGAVAGELDETPEFEGAAEAYSNAASARSLAKRLRGSRSAGKEKSAGAHEGKTASSKNRPSKVKTARKAQREAAKAKSMATVRAAEGAGATAATVATAERASAAKGLGSAIASATAPAAGVLAGVLAFVLCALVASQLVSAIFGFWKSEADKQKMEGLPPYITYEMVEAALECQEEYGHPAGCTLAQIICESGQGDHMSQLATRDHNLFGMKWSSRFAAAPEVSGKAAWVTGEEYGGQQVTITDYFTVFKSDADCIKFRSRVFLAQSHFANQPLIKEAIANHDSDKMAEGLKAGGWATSSSYVETLKSLMDAYDLRRFDTMSLEALKDMGQARATVVQAAYSQIGVPYVWGGTTPGVGLDCSGLTQYCYKQAGIPIPRNSEAQANHGVKIPVSQAKPSDILWRPGHVAIYVGDDKYVHEPHAGSSCREATGVGYFTAAIRVIA